MLRRGSHIHDYEVWGRLGEGGMSEVWLAKHTVLCIPVILKTLRKSVAESVGEAGARRMFSEARLMARVTSPRVVRAIDAGAIGGVDGEPAQPYLVQEYVDGVDLAELDRERRAALGVGLPLWMVCRVMEETCRALHAAHQAGVIHRDVKPSNLFAAPETGFRLGDFGIAVARADGPQREISGTIRFMAPEQLGGGAIDRRTDAYGAGATAFDLRYGTPPYETMSAILDAQARPAFPPARSPGEAYFQHLLSGMLCKDPEGRPVDLAEPAEHFGTLSQSLRPGAAGLAFSVLGKDRARILDCDISMHAGDLADAEADAIVSSARWDMSMRSGVADALRTRGGDAIEGEAAAGGERALGECIATGAGQLKARHVLHAVSAWNETSCVGRAMLRALAVADRLGVRSLALPALGTGSAHVSLETCANAMATALRWRLALGGSRLKKVTFVLGDESKLATFRDVALEALRDQDDAPRPIDLGLPDERRDVNVDAATCIDAGAAALTK